MTGAWLLVSAVAHAFRNFTELPPASNRGQVVDRFIEFVGLEAKDQLPWCAAFVSYVGYYGLYDPTTKESHWPLPRTAACSDLAKFAAHNNVLVDTPAVGDLFLIWHPELNRFAHTGFIVSANGFGSWNTIEGNTSLPGDPNPKTQREGWGVFGRVRKFAAEDRFVRWTTLLDPPTAATVIA